MDLFTIKTTRMETLINSIAAQSYGIFDDFLTPSERLALAQTLYQKYTSGTFKKAGIGQGADYQIQNQIRGDQILWLEEENALPAEQLFFEKMYELIQYLNRTCYLGLKDGEFHYALYPTGTFYKRHLDRFRHDSRRRISAICYLNQDWQPSEGGELVIYPENQEAVKILPIGGRLVCFEADKLEHEVLPATRERLSLTGWLRVY
ncbi:MAG: 2OG-Fe(II) oxygenase [Runella sp.]